MTKNAQPTGGEGLAMTDRFSPSPEGRIRFNSIKYSKIAV